MLHELQRLNAETIKLERDVRHLESDVGEIKTTLDTHGTKLDKLKEELTRSLHGLEYKLTEKIQSISQEQIKLGTKIAIFAALGAAMLSIGGQVLVKVLGIGA